MNIPAFLRRRHVPEPAPVPDEDMPGVPDPSDRQVAAVAETIYEGLLPGRCLADASRGVRVHYCQVARDAIRALDPDSCDVPSDPSIIA